MNKLIAIIFSGVALSACAEDPQYHRTECIVRVNIDWTTTDGDKDQLIQEILDVYLKAPKLGFNEIPPSAAVQGDMDQFLYFQHKYDCEDRISNTEQLLEYIQGNVQGLPEMEVDRGTFQPAADTIRTSGRWWIDSEASPFDGRE